MRASLAYAPAAVEPAPGPLHQRFVVLTGGSSGIGRALASQLADAGASVLVGSRRPIASRFEQRPLDLASQQSVAEFARDLRRRSRPIDMLVLNAGVHVPWKRLTTADGQELHWQVNYLANFLLCHELLDLCRRSALKRILYVASEAHRLASLPAGPLLGFWRRYARSKQAAVTFFLRLQELHPELTVRVASPGYVDSAVHRHKGRLAARLERTWSRPRTPEAAADEMLRCFDEAGAVYWDRGAPARPAAACTRAARADALWSGSLEALRGHLPGARAPQRIANFAGTFRALGPAVLQPATAEELAAVVRQAAQAGRGVRVVGQRHSYNDSFFSRTCMVSLQRLDRVLSFDAAGATVTCQAGISIAALCDHLDRQGLALRYSGNFGGQTLAGALATGTHGYGREGGLMSELVRAMTVVLPDGSVRRATAERDLRALRLGLGALGAVVEVTLAVDPVVPCRYRAACLPRAEFVARLGELAEENEYLRFVPHPFDPRAVFYVTINREPDGAPAAPVTYLNDVSPGAARWLAPWLRLPPVRLLLGRAFRLAHQGYEVRVPFSSRLFVLSGVVPRHAQLAKAGQLALEQHRWLNMELAVPRERYPDFERLFAEERPRALDHSPRRPYYTCRVVGAADNVLLAPNHGRDVVFCDVHADPRQASSLPFLRRLEGAAMRGLDARPHWGKVSFATPAALEAAYPAANWAAFAAAKRRLDPEGIFSNDFTRSRLGL
jgi:L-gulono-1,4-lactone dehydrogenase